MINNVEQKVGITPNGSLVILTPLYAKYFPNTDIYDFKTMTITIIDQDPVLYLLEYEDSGIIETLNPTILDELIMVGDL